jgi:hypothetical protein
MQTLPATSALCLCALPDADVAEMAVVLVTGRIGRFHQRAL